MRETSLENVASFAHDRNHSREDAGENSATCEDHGIPEKRGMPRC